MLKPYAFSQDIGLVGAMVESERDRASVAAQRRRHAYVAAAKDAFFNRGYAGTTMSSIAEEVGGSKTTLWSYYPAKDALFAAVVDEIVERHGKAASVDLTLDRPARAILLELGISLLDTLFSPQILALHRLVAGEANRFPQLAKHFYQRGPARGKERLAAFLGALMQQGGMRQGDPALAGRQFFGLCEGGKVHSVLFGNRPVPDHRERRREVEAAVESFCRAWDISS